MNRFAAIVGQERAVGRLRAALASGRTHHAYLFDGPDGVGKRTAALAYAQAANCERHATADGGCGECGPCRKIADGTHPDVILFPVFNEEGKVKEQTERVRDLIARLAYPPHEGRARVVLIDPAHELNQNASNVLLKTLEEPPPRTHFILVTTAVTRLLPTIRSRCQQVAFAPLPGEVIARQLVAAHAVDEAAAGVAASLAGGSLGRALEVASSEELPRRRERVERLIGAASAQAAGRGGRTVQALLEGAGELAGDRDEALATLELMWVVYRDAIVTGSGLGAGAASDGAGARLAERVAPARLLGGLRAVDEAVDAIRGWVSPQLALERLLLRIARVGAA